MRFSFAHDNDEYHSFLEQVLDKLRGEIQEVVEDGMTVRPTCFALAEYPTDQGTQLGLSSMGNADLPLPDSLVARELLFLRVRSFLEYEHGSGNALRAVVVAVEGSRRLLPAAQSVGPEGTYAVLYIARYDQLPQICYAPIHRQSKQLGTFTSPQEVLPWDFPDIIPISLYGKAAAA